jgi:hypothetical protein
MIFIIIFEKHNYIYQFGINTFRNKIIIFLKNNY